MGTLPSCRINITHPFSNSGVDFAGPFLYKSSKLRSAKLLKCYICLFICMATKAIHLELATDLSASGFIAALKRFISRRGICTNLYSDCGTNFVGAQHLLQKELKQAFQENFSEIAPILAEQNIHWHFNPPSTPHFGGIWESGVKVVKSHIKRIIQNTKLTLEEFQTLLCQIEACVNSRPLTPISDDPNDYTSLTPGHFLIGRYLLAVPEPEINEKMSLTNRWLNIQNLTQHFWKRWSKEYLHTLQQRYKWQEEHQNIQPNDLVLIKDERCPPTRWPLGRITHVHPGGDGKVRVVTVKTNSAEYLRPITKICKLPVQKVDNDIK